MIKKYLLPVLKVFGFILVYFIALIVINGLLYSALGPAMTREMSATLVGAASLLVSLIVVFLFLKLDDKRFKDIGVSFQRGWYRKLLMGSALGAAAILIIFAVLLASGAASLRGLAVTGLMSIILIFVRGFVYFLIAVAFTEELITRGYIYHYLKTRFTIAGASVVASFFFALMHILNSNATILALFNIFLAGMVLNLLVIKDGNIWSAVGFHFGWNFTMGTIFASPVSGGMEEGIVKLSLKGYELLTGGSFGIEGGLVCTVVLLATSGYLLLHNEQKEKYLDGMKLWKNRIFTGALVIITLVYVIFDILVWLPKPVVSDSIEVNKISRYENANNYTMKLELDTKGRKITGHQKVSFINSAGTNLNEIYFHVYPNAFKELGGYIDVKAVKVDGLDVKFTIEGEDSTLLRVSLPGTLEPGKRDEISMDYLISIPKGGGNGFGDRFGYGSNTYNLGNFFPIVAVYENNGWDKHLYDEKGDAFYSETSNFDVEITAPIEQVIAATGYIQNREVDGSRQKLNITAYSVRDFAFVSSDMFKVEEAMVNGTLIKSYASSRIKAKKVLEISSDAIKFFNRKYGKYPYPSCSVVQSDLGGGMEYPNLVMIEANDYGNITFGNLFSSYFYGRPKGALEFIVVHELAHQWWYGLVGNDEYREAWIDEPLAQYSTLVYLKEKYGIKDFERVYNNEIKLGARMYLLGSRGQEKSMNLPLNQFDYNGYYILIYNKGTMMFKDLNDQLGDEKFDFFLKALFEQYEFKVVKGEELIKLTSEAAGRDMQEFYTKWLTTNYTGDEL
ncbi:MAG: M1 family aminopeptidase [Caulobacteraceae bacterium]